MVSLVAVVRAMGCNPCLHWQCYPCRLTLIVLHNWSSLQFSVLSIVSFCHVLVRPENESVNCCGCVLQRETESVDSDTASSICTYYLRCLM